MPTYAIGDIHGCSLTLGRLLERIDYTRGRDRLWLVGDLVNRGPGSLDVLRWAREQGDSVVAVLGNHDLHLLACAHGKRRQRPRDTFYEVLSAHDSDELLDWLRCRPLVHREGRFILVHAGVLPGWTLEILTLEATQIEKALQGKKPRRTLSWFYNGSPPPKWRKGLTPERRLQFAVWAMTRLRMCSKPLRPSFSYSGRPEEAPRGLRPWYDWPIVDAPDDHVVIFGHWAALGRRLMPHAWGLDSGCAWGGSLSAVRLEDGEVFEEPCADELWDAA